jgi:hypothetical protein
VAVAAGRPSTAVVSPTGGGVVKRGRGRPRKYPWPSYEIDSATSDGEEGETAAAAAAAGAAAAGAEAAAGAAGDQPSTAVPSSTGGGGVVKRGRGRPRKYPRPSYEADAAIPSPTAGSGGVKRGRGRPRKYPRPSYEVDAAKTAHALEGRQSRVERDGGGVLEGPSTLAW